MSVNAQLSQTHGQNMPFPAVSDNSHVRNGVVRSASVSGQAHMPRKRLLLLAGFALGVLAVPAVSGAIPSHNTSTLRAHDAALAAQSRAATLQLYSLDQRLAGAQSHLGALQARTERLRAERVSLGHQLSVAKRGTHIAERRLATRLRTLYEEGDVEPLEIVFGAKTIDEAVTGLDNLSRMTSQGEDDLRQLQTARVSLGSASRRLASREAALVTAVRDARATQTALVSARSQRQAYLGSLAAQRRLTQQQIAAVVEQAAAARSRTQQLSRVSAAEALSGSPAPTEAAAAIPYAPGSRAITVSATGY